MGEVVVAETAAPKQGRSNQVGLLNLDKYRHANLRLTQQSQSDNNEKSEEKDPSLSPEYKSLWSDVHIQGDYDQYARSTAKAKQRKQAENSPVAKISDTPQVVVAQNNPAVQNQVSRQRRTRIKLNRPVLQLPIDLPAQTPRAMEAEKLVTKTSISPRTEGKESQPVIGRHDDDVQKGGANQLGNGANQNERVEMEPIKNRQEDVETKTDPVLKNKSINKHEPSKVSESRHKSGHDFVPPVISAMELRPRDDAREFLFSNNTPHIGSFAIRDGRLEYGVDYHAAHGALSRQSAVFMADYLELGAGPVPSMVTSIIVKPILPPLRGRNIKVLNRLRKSKWSKRGEKQAPPPQPDNSPVNSSKMETGPDATQLSPVRDHSHFHAAKHDTEASERYDWDLGGMRRKRHQLWKKDEDSIFDQVVRWRSKARHCSNPAMYRRITSPTLGEMALRRKMTDSLPTRQTRRPRPTSKELQPREASESWRRAPSHVTQPRSESMTQVFDTKISGRASMRKMGSLHRGWNAHAQERPLMEAPSILMDLPHPQMPVRKRRPVWQRMR